jgi:hypothetical protein
LEEERTNVKYKKKNEEKWLWKTIWR